MKYEHDLKAVLSEIVNQWDIPGMAVGIVEDSKVTFTFCSGVQNLESGKPVTPRSVFCTASISKCFVATTVMQFVQTGQIDLDVSITNYLPYFRMADDRFHQVNIRQLLSHTSGMPDIDESDYDKLVANPEWDEGSAERFVRGLSGLKLVSEPGREMHYSNIGYDILGDILSKVGGTSFEDVIKAATLVSAGMMDSTFLYSEVDPDRIAVPHLRSPQMKVSPFYPYHRADAPASFLHSTLEDMCLWAIVSLNNGEIDGGRLLPAYAYTLMWTPVADRGYSRPGIYEDMGLGWTLGHFKGAQTISHGGMGFGWTDFLLLLPEKNRAAVILCNEESYARTNTMRAVANVMLDEQPEIGQVSWMVPITRAMAAGGMKAAYECYEELKAEDSQEYYFDEEDLCNLSLQLVCARNYDMAVGVLGLNSYVYPEHIGTYLQQAKLYFHHGEPALAERTLKKALEIEPENEEVEEMLKKVMDR